MVPVNPGFQTRLLTLLAKCKLVPLPPEVDSPPSGKKTLRAGADLPLLRISATRKRNYRPHHQP
jgi:hypothetical protein